MVSRDGISVALGKKPADLVILSGTLLDVYSGRLVPNRSLAIVGDKIVYVGEDVRAMIGPDTEVIDAGGRIMCPGYMDAHTHLGNYWNIADFLHYSIPGGTTSYVTEGESYGFAMGSAGFETFLAQTVDRPVNFFCLIPPMVTKSKAVERFFIPRDDVRRLLAQPGVIGLGEPYWQGVVFSRDERLLGLMEETVAAGRLVQGHAAGAKGGKLAAYVLTGAASCHEAISADDVLERLEMGLYAMIRHGDIRQDIEIILPLKDRIDFRRVILVTDGTNPEMLLEHGYLVDVLQKTLDLGMPLVDVVRMVTLNPAEHLGLDQLLGGLAPGRQADVLLLPNPGCMRPDIVIAKGKMVARDGAVTVDLPRRPYDPEILRTVRLSPVSAADFTVSAPADSGSMSVRTMDVQPGGLVTREGRADVPVADGKCMADPDSDLLKVVFVERAGGKGEKFVGFVRGWGLKRGAVASSVTWDCLGVTAVGADDVSLAAAINRVIELQGGSVACLGDKVLAEIPFSVGGYVSELPLPEVAARMKEFQRAAGELGSTLPYAHLTLNVLTATAIPFIKLTEDGYFRFRENDVVGL